jgi:glycosyltransferase involved in cell wall biosynthesis
MRLAIDALNLRGGGGQTHLLQLLQAAKPQEHGFERVTIWAGSSILDQIGSYPWLCKVHEPMLDRPLPARLQWQLVKLEHLACRERCDVLFVPGGAYAGAFRPFVTMSRNMLPFEWAEARRYGISWRTAKFLVLKRAQLSTFKRANGLIFLTQYAYATVGRFLGQSEARIVRIPHGIDDRFRYEPRSQRPISLYSFESPFRLLYVSPIAPYKHQWHVMEAVYRLRQAGYPLVLELVGPLGVSKRRFLGALSRLDPQGNWIIYRGKVPFQQLHATYHQADAFVYASSCENMPNILLEAMAAGLPIACSSQGPMPEVLGDAGAYFDPEKPAEIAAAVQVLLDDHTLRERKAWAAFARAESFTWERCARETFDFIAQIAANRDV